MRTPLPAAWTLLLGSMPIATHVVSPTGGALFRLVQRAQVLRITSLTVNDENGTNWGNPALVGRSLVLTRTLRLWDEEEGAGGADGIAWTRSLRFAESSGANLDSVARFADTVEGSAPWVGARVAYRLTPDANRCAPFEIHGAPEGSAARSAGIASALLEPLACGAEPPSWTEEPTSWRVDPSDLRTIVQPLPGLQIRPAFLLDADLDALEAGSLDRASITLAQLEALCLVLVDRVSAEGRISGEARCERRGRFTSGSDEHGARELVDVVLDLQLRARVEGEDLGLRSDVLVWEPLTGFSIDAVDVTYRLAGTAEMVWDLADSRNDTGSASFDTTIEMDMAARLYFLGYENEVKIRLVLEGTTHVCAATDDLRFDSRR